MKFQVHKYSMIVMDAAHYWTEFEDTATVQDVIDLIKQEYPEDHGEIIFDEQLPTISFDHSVFDIVDGDLSEYPIARLKITHWYRSNSYTFDVILEP